MKHTAKSLMAIALASIFVLSGCNGGKTGADSSPAASGSQAAPATESTASGNAVELEFWSAPVPQQQAFWESMATQYTAENPQVKITVSAIPESPSSEAGIQSAIASGTAPAMSENVFRGFAAQLAENQALVPFDSFEGLDEVIAQRDMKNVMAQWQFADGHQYVLPVFSNPSMFLWRIDLLRELGVEEAPRTYSEVYALGEKLKAQSPDKFVWASQDFNNTSWYKRWWDFLTMYNAASAGAAFVEGGKLSADDTAAVAVLGFFEEMNKKGYVLAQESTDPFETGLSVATQYVPFRFKAMHEKYPDLQYGENYIVAPVPVPDGSSTENIKTMGDTKGVVIYAQASPEQQQASYQFLKWVLSGDHDAEWMSTTNLIPAQDNIVNSPALAETFAKNPELVPFAENVANAVPAMDSAKYVEIHTALGEKGMVPVLAGSKSAADAWQDIKAEIENVLG